MGPDGKLKAVPWQPLWKCHLAHPAGVGELGLCHMVNAALSVLVMTPSPRQRRTYLIPCQITGCKFVACSEDGEFLSGDWAATSEDD